MKLSGHSPALYVKSYKLRLLSGLQIRLCTLRLQLTDSQSRTQTETEFACCLHAVPLWVNSGALNVQHVKNLVENIPTLTIVTNRMWRNSSFDIHNILTCMYIVAEILKLACKVFSLSVEESSQKNPVSLCSVLAAEAASRMAKWANGSYS